VAKNNHTWQKAGPLKHSTTGVKEATRNEGGVSWCTRCRRVSRRDQAHWEAPEELHRGEIHKEQLLPTLPITEQLRKPGWTIQHWQHQVYVCM